MFNYRLNSDRLTIIQLYSNKAILQGAGSLFLLQSNKNVDLISHNYNFISHIVTLYSIYDCTFTVTTIPHNVTVYVSLHSEV